MMAGTLRRYRMQQSTMMHFLGPRTRDLTIRYIRLSAAWLASLAALAPPEAHAAFERVPSFVVSDICLLLTTLATHSPEELGHSPLIPLVQSLAVLLRAGCACLCEGRRPLLRSPVVLSHLVDVLHVLVLPDRRRRGGTSASLLGASGWGGDVGGRFSEAVLGNASVRLALMLPLAATFTAVDAVEGLDVDAVESEGFEKFSLRGKLCTLLQHLCAESTARILQVVSRRGGALTAGTFLIRVGGSYPTAARRCSARPRPSSARATAARWAWRVGWPSRCWTPCCTSWTKRSSASAR